MARAFNGTSSDLISYPRPTQVDGVTQLTVLLNWVQPGSLNNYAPILTWLDAALSGLYVSHQETIEGFIRVLIGDASGYAAFSWGGITPGQVARIAITYDGALAQASRVAVYINGAAGSIFSGTTTWPPTAGTSTVGFTLGGSPTHSTYANADSLSEVAIYTRVLSASEIAAHGAGYAPSTLGAQGRVFYAPLIRDATDLHGAAATVTGTTVVTHPRMIYARGVTHMTLPSVTTAALTLHEVVSDETDTTYAKSSSGSASDVMEVGFPSMGTPQAGPVTFYIRHQKTP